MRRTVWKYAFEVDDVPAPLVIPRGGTVLHVGLDPAPGDRLAVWADVPVPDRMQDLVMENLRLRVTGTGHDVPADAEHLGSVVAGSFVWHVWRLP